MERVLIVVADYEPGQSASFTTEAQH